MKFNQSVIVGNVLTFLSDSARQEKFGAFKVDPDSIKQVLIPADGLESTTQGKYYNGVWMVFLNFPKVFKGINPFENDELFLYVFRINFL